MSCGSSRVVSGLHGHLKQGAHYETPGPHEYYFRVVLVGSYPISYPRPQIWTESPCENAKTTRMDRSHPSGLPGTDPPVCHPCVETLVGFGLLILVFPETTHTHVMCDSGVL